MTRRTRVDDMATWGIILAIVAIVWLLMFAT